MPNNQSLMQTFVRSKERCSLLRKGAPFLNNALLNLKYQEFDKAIRMLHHIKNDTVWALNDTKREQME